MTTHALLNAVAANRKQFFELVEALEKASDCHISEETLMGLIDSEYDGRDRLTRKEADTLLFACSHKRKKRS